MHNGVMTWLRRLGQNRLLDLGAAFIAVLSVWRIIAVLPSRVWDFDFNHFYISSRLLVRGQNPYLVSLEPMSKEMGFEFSGDLPIPHYPPSFLWMFAPLAGLAPRTAFWVWVMIEVLSLGLLLWLTRHLLSNRLSPRGWMFVCVGAVACLPVYSQFYYSQMQLQLAAIGLGAYALYRRGQYAAACLAVAAAGMLKFYPFVLLPWFVWRSGGGVTARINRAFSAVAFSVIIVLVTSPGLWRDFVHLGMPVAAANEINQKYHYAAPSLVTNLGFARSGFMPSKTAARVWWAAGTATGLGTIALAYLMCYRSDRDDETEFCLLSVAMLAGIVTVQGNYFVWLIFPLAHAALRVAARPSGQRVLLLSLVALLVNQIIPPPESVFRNHVYLRILINYIPFYGLVALGVFLSGELTSGKRRVRSESDSEEQSCWCRRTE
jgi:hypothetical protein